MASRTLTGDLEWQNARLLEGDLLDEVAALRDGEGGVNGSISVVRQLVFAGLLDALTLTTHPLVAGSAVACSSPGPADATLARGLQQDEQGQHHDDVRPARLTAGRPQAPRAGGV